MLALRGSVGPGFSQRFGAGLSLCRHELTGWPRTTLQEAKGPQQNVEAGKFANDHRPLFEGRWRRARRHGMPESTQARDNKQCMNSELNTGVGEFDGQPLQLVQCPTDTNGSCPMPH